MIPARKLTLEYIENLHAGFGFAGEVLDAVYGKAGTYPGQFRASGLKVFLLHVLLLLTGKTRAERRIRLAIEKGRLAARSELRRMWQTRSRFS